MGGEEDAALKDCHCFDVCAVNPTRWLHARVVSVALESSRLFCVLIWTQRRGDMMGVVFLFSLFNNGQLNNNRGIVHKANYHIF